MNIQQITVGPLQANCFVVWGEQKQALVLDPGADPDLILNVLSSEGLGVALYVLTHGHVDHISAAARLAGKMPAPFAMHAADLSWAFKDDNQLPPFHPAPDRPETESRDLSDGDDYNDGGLSYRIIHTPGHSPGSVCLHFVDDKCLFTGDTLFDGSVGRTDFPGGDAAELVNSLKLLTKLPDETTIYPGHGPATDLANQKKTNYFLQGLA